MWFNTINKDVPNKEDDGYGDSDFMFKVPRFTSAENSSTNPTEYVRSFDNISPGLEQAKQTLASSQNLWFKLFENWKTVDFAVIKSEIDKQPNIDQKLAKILQIEKAMVWEIEIYLKNYEVVANNKSTAWLQTYENMVTILLKLNLYVNEIGQQMQSQWMSENQIKQKLSPYLQETSKNFNGYNTVLAFLEVIENPRSIDQKRKEMENVHQKFKSYAWGKNDYLQWLIKNFNTTNDVNQKKQIMAEFKKFIDWDIKTYYYEVYNVYKDYWPHFQPAKVDEFFANFEFGKPWSKQTFVNLTNKGYDLATSLMQNAKDIYDEVIGAHNQMYNKLYPEKEQS